MQTNDIHKHAEEIISDAIKIAPSYSLPDNFADMVAKKAVRQFAWRQYFQEFLVYLYAFLGLAAVTITVAFFWLGADWQVWKQVLADHSSTIIGINILTLFVLFADKVLLRYFMYRYSKYYKFHEL